MRFRASYIASEPARLAVVVLLFFGVTAPSLLAQSFPNIAFVTPTTAAAGDPNLTITVTGSGFAAESQVMWDTVQLQTTVVSLNQLRAAVPADLLTTAGTFSISVMIPVRGRSNIVPFTVLPGALSVSTPELPAGFVGTPYAITMAATGGIAPYTWTATGLPPGLSLSPAGVMTGSPSVQGQFNVDFQVADSQQRAASRTLSLTVSPPPLSITTPETLPGASIGILYSVALTAQNATPPLRWTLGPGVPAGLTLNPSTGVLSGTLLSRGTFSFGVDVADSAGRSATRRFTLAVAAPPLVISTVTPLFTGVAGAPYSQTFTATGGTLPYTWSTTSQIPGLTLDAGSGALSGTPEAPGTFSIAVQVRDSDNVTIAKSFSLVIEQPRVSIPVNTLLPAGTVGVPYQFKMLAAGGTPPYTWSLVSGSVPGLTLNAVTGMISDTPAAAGTFALVIRAADATGITAERTFSITIAPGAPRITPAEHPFSATVASSFETSITATGGVPPYAWTANGLPDGLSMDPATARISGAPRVAGSFLFTVRMTDGARSTVTQLFQLDVAFPPVPALRATQLSAVTPAASQPSFQLELAAPYPVPISGQLLLTFGPRTGQGDATVQFATGGRSLEFTIPAGSTIAEFRTAAAQPVATPAIQTGTVAGNLMLTARLRSGDIDIVPTPVSVQTVQVEPAAPVVVSARSVRVSGGLEVQITGYSTAREVTQAVFRFSGGGAATLSTSEITVPVEEMFARWFSDSGSVEFGSQFTFTQTFTTQGDAALVTPVSVTLTNRLGSTTAQIAQ